MSKKSIPRRGEKVLLITVTGMGGVLNCCGQNNQIYIYMYSVLWPHKSSVFHMWTLEDASIVVCMAAYLYEGSSRELGSFYLLWQKPWRDLWRACRQIWQSHEWRSSRFLCHSCHSPVSKVQKQHSNRPCKNRVQHQTVVILPLRPQSHSLLQVSHSLTFFFLKLCFTFCLCCVSVGCSCRRRRFLMGVSVHSNVHLTWL